MQKHVSLIFIFLLSSLAFFFRPGNLVFAGSPQSTNFTLTNFEFGAGGTASSSSTTYSLFGNIGETSNASPSSQNYRLGSGLVYTMIASVPAAPTFTNPSNYYNKLLISIKPIINPSDFRYAVAISKDNFVTDTEYIQPDNTIATNFSILNFRTFTNWGGASGTTIIGLLPNTTYTVKVKARQGFYTESPWGSTTQAATINPTMSFSLSSNNISLGSMTPGSIATSGTITTTVTTNGTGGTAVYIYDKNAGLLSSSTGYTINAVSNNLGSTTEGYGVQGQSVTQTSGGPMEILSPYNSSGNTVGLINTTEQNIFDSSGQAVTSGQGTFQLQAKPSTTAKAATDYTDTITVIATGLF